MGRLRVTPIPRREPPRITADDAFAPTPPPTGFVQGVLALVDPAPDPHDAHGTGGVGSPGGTRGTGGTDPAAPADDPYFDRQPTARQHLPRPEAFAAGLGQALVEVMWGARPPSQVVRWTSDDVQAVVARRSLVATRRGLRSGRPPVVRRVRVCEPADGIAEVSLVVIAGGRVRAIALRLEGLDGRWVVTELLVG